MSNCNLFVYFSIVTSFSPLILSACYMLLSFLCNIPIARSRWRLLPNIFWECLPSHLSFYTNYFYSCPSIFCSCASDLCSYSLAFSSFDLTRHEVNFSGLFFLTYYSRRPGVRLISVRGCDDICVFLLNTDLSSCHPYVSLFLSPDWLYKRMFYV